MPGLIGGLINVLILIYAARRLLGVPVGWGRAALVSAAVISIPYRSFQSLLTQYGINDDTPLLPLTLVMVVAMGCIVTFELIVLTVLEVFVPTRKVPSLTQFVTGIPAALRRARRYLAIWWILLRRGLTTYLGPASKIDVESTRVARSVRRALTDAGVTFVKFGQMLATRADLLPPAFVKELSKLHSQVEAEPWAAVEPVIADELARPIGEVFQRLDPTPLAAASVAQIHEARLADGTDVVVKVQRPKARQQVTADLDILHRLARRLEKTTAWGRQIGAVGLAEGFAASLHEELDYRVEVANMRGVAAAGEIRVPRSFEELSGERVIVMERIAGQPLSSADLGALPADRRRALATELLGGVLRQIFVTGTFHADLHPGNIVVTDDGSLALLDFGSVGRLDRPTRSALVMLLHAVDREDSIAATDALLNLLDRPAGLDERTLEREIGVLIVRQGAAPGGSATLFGALLDMVVRHGFRVPPMLAAVFRTLGTLDGTLQLLDPGFDLVAEARAKGAEVARELTGRDAVRRQIDQQLATLLPLLARLPRRIARISEQLEDGTLQVNVRTLSHAEDRSYLTRVGGQLNLTLLGSAMGVGGLFLLTRDGGPMLLPQMALWPFLGVTLLFLAFTLGARVLASIFFRD